MNQEHTLKLLESEKAKKLLKDENIKLEKIE